MCGEGGSREYVHTSKGRVMCGERGSCEYVHISKERVVCGEGHLRECT